MLKELMMDILKHGYNGITVEYSDICKDDSDNRGQFLSITEYEEPRTTWRTTFALESGDSCVVAESYLNGELKFRERLNLEDFKWRLSGYHLFVYSKNKDSDPSEWYVFDLNQPSDVIVAS